MDSSSAYLLLSIPNATIQSNSTNLSGTLGLQCVTVPTTQDVYLILHIESFELPLEPSRSIDYKLLDSGSRIYTFKPTEIDPTEFTLTVSNPGSAFPHLLEDLDTFDSILSQYSRLRGLPEPAAISKGQETGIVSVPGGIDHLEPSKGQKISLNDSQSDGNRDLRGRLVLVNQDNGELVGEFDQQFRVLEDPALKSSGNENAPIILEVPEDAELQGRAIEVFARLIPPDQQDWMTKSATLVSHAISTTSNLLMTVISASSSYAISHTTPSPNKSEFSQQDFSTPSSSSSGRATVFLSADKARTGLATVHAFSGQVVKVSNQTLKLIDRMIDKAIGAGGSSLKGRATSANPSPLPSPTVSGRQSPVPPPPYSPSTSNSTYLSPESKPALPPRKTPSPTPSPIGASTSVTKPPSLPPRSLSRKARLVLSADLILTTLDESVKELLGVSTESIDAFVRHKYGDDAATTSNMVGGTARNFAIVYIDMRGVGRKALIKRVGKRYIKNKFAGQDKLKP